MSRASKFSESLEVPFKDYESMVQSANLCFSIATLLQVGLSECCSVNARVGSNIFEGERAKELVPTFGKVLDYLKDAYSGFSNRAAQLKDKPRDGGSDMGVGPHKQG